MAKRLEKQVWVEIEADIAGGMSRADAAKKYGITYQAVHNHYALIKKREAKEVTE